jgi:hypothetical protein
MLSLDSCNTELAELAVEEESNMEDPPEIEEPRSDDTALFIVESDSLLVEAPDPLCADSEPRVDHVPGVR